MRARAAPREHFGWIESRTGCVLTRAAKVIEAVDVRGLVRGQVAYDGWTPAAVQCHMAVDTPVAWRALLPAVFEYPFIQGGRSVILGTIRSDNARSLEMVRRLGFVEAHRVPRGWDDAIDLVVVEMRRENCRWLKGVKHGLEERTAAA